MPPLAVPILLGTLLLAAAPSPRAQVPVAAAGDRVRVIVVLRLEAAPAEDRLEALMVAEALAPEADGETRNRWRGRRDALLSAALERASGSPRQRLAAWVAARHGRVTHRYRAFPALAATVPAPLVEALRAHPDVAAIYTDGRRRPLLDTLPATIGLGAFTNTGGSVDVAVVDTGVYAAHPALAALAASSRIRSVISLGQACPANDCGPDNTIEDPTSPDDFQGHGTQVAGIVASQGWPGFAAFKGVVPGLRKLVNVKAFTAGGFYDSDVIGGVDAALGLDGGDVPEVINASLGAVTFSDPPTADPYDREALAKFFDAVASTRNKVLVVAAGNNGPSPLTVESPGIAYNVICVGATDTKGTSSRADDVVWANSARGPAKGAPGAVFLRKKPDIAAPGQGLRTTDYLGGLSDGSIDEEAVGTSLAAPVVSGLAALLFDAPGLGDGTVFEIRKALAVRALLINSAEDRNANYPATTTPDGWDAAWGWGYVDGARAHAERGGVAASDITIGVTRYFRRQAVATTKATLVWDRPVTFSTTAPAAAPLKNLDLRLYALSTGQQRAASLSTVDNVEQVTSASSEAAVLVVESPDAHAVGESTPFALAYAGGFVPVGPPTLSVQAGASQRVAPGAVFGVTATVQNAGAQPGLPVFGVAAQIGLPAGFSLVSGSAIQAIGTLQEQSSAPVQWIVRAPSQETSQPFTLSATGSGFGLTFAPGTQGGAIVSAVCDAFTIAPAVIELPASGGSQAIAIGALSADCGWAAISDQPWLAVASSPIGTGPATVTVNATANPTTAERRATLTIANRAVTVVQAAPRRTYYLAEGATGDFFDLDVLVANPNATAAPVTLSFLKPDGSVEVLTDELPATSRRTYRVDQLPGLASTAVSTVVESTSGAPLVVERTMFWDREYYGGHGGGAVTEPSRTWYFAEGSQGFFDTFVLLANPGATAANVTVTFLLEQGDPIVFPLTVGPTSRQNVWAIEPGNGALVGRSFAIRVDADVPIIAERAMYFGTAPGNRQWNGGHESAGVPALATSWFHAEGATGPVFDEYILVGNPGDATAEVTFTFLLTDGQVIAGRASVPPRSRFTLPVEDAGLLLTITSGDAARLREAEVSTTVESNVPIVSERAMYWPGNSTTWAEAHNSFGVTETATRWGLAEGRVGGPLAYSTFVLLANPNPVPARVQLTYLRTNGTTVVREIEVAANSRQNEWVNALTDTVTGAPLLADEEFGVLVESLDGVPIAVERAMYWDAPGAPFFAGGTNATAVRIP